MNPRRSFAPLLARGVLCLCAWYLLSAAIRAVAGPAGLPDQARALLLVASAAAVRWYPGRVACAVVTVTAAGLPVFGGARWTALHEAAVALAVAAVTKLYDIDGATPWGVVLSEDEIHGQGIAR